MYVDKIPCADGWSDDTFGYLQDKWTNSRKEMINWLVMYNTTHTFHTVSNKSMLHEENNARWTCRMIQFFSSLLHKVWLCSSCVAHSEEVGSLHRVQPYSTVHVAGLDTVHTPTHTTLEPIARRREEERGEGRVEGREHARTWQDSNSLLYTT